MATRRLSHKCEYNDLNIVYVTDYYDFALGGLCRNKDGVLCKFEWDDFIRDGDLNEDYYKVFYMTPIEKFRALFSKTMFELCVGYHQTYDKGKKTKYFYEKKPQWFWKKVKNFYFWCGK